MFAAKYQLKRVTVAILNCASFHSLCCLVNRKGKLLNKRCFYRNNKMFSGINSYNTCSNVIFRHWHSPTTVLSLVYCPVDDTLFEVSRDLCCSGVLSRYCYYGNHTADSKPMQKLFYHSRLRIEYGISMPKIISECCELVKLCHINCSGPVF